MSKQLTYAVQRIDDDEERHGPVHWAIGMNETICGERIDHMWLLTYSTYEEDVTCEQCQEILNARNNA